MMNSQTWSLSASDSKAWKNNISNKYHKQHNQNTWHKCTIIVIPNIIIIIIIINIINIINIIIKKNSNTWLATTTTTTTTISPSRSGKSDSIFTSESSNLSRLFSVLPVVVFVGLVAFCLKEKRGNAVWHVVFCLTKHAAVVFWCLKKSVGNNKSKLTI